LPNTQQVVPGGQSVAEAPKGFTVPGQNLTQSPFNDLHVTTSASQLTKTAANISKNTMDNNIAFILLCLFEHYT